MPETPTTDPQLRALLRAEVGGFRRRESRRVFDTSVHVGELAGPRAGFVVRAQDLPAMDVALRTDVVCALVEETPDQWGTAWLVRPGTPEPHDLDLAWHAAFRAGFSSHDRRLRHCFVITRVGWRDLVSDETRTWARLRL